jgi:histidinol-phosphate aminotransferase
MEHEMSNTPSREIGRSSVRDIRAYVPDAAPVRVDLSDNTNRWGSPPAAIRAMIEAATGGAAPYDDAYATDLKSALAEKLGVSSSMIIIGCGSDDVLDCAFRALGEPGDLLATIHPTFVMARTFALANALRVVPVPLTATFDADADAIRATGARLVYLCSPNNPTGTPLARSTVERIVDQTSGLVLIDEAYAEFATETMVDLATSRENVLIVRTFSKAYGLAGLRIGYGIGAPALIGNMEKVRGPFKVSGVAERAALAALTEGAEWVKTHASLARENRGRLLTALRERGLDPVPSDTNFVLVPMPRAAAVASAMEARGVRIRAFVGLPPITPALAATAGDAIRISVGPSAEIEAALTALDEARVACV